MSSDHDRKQPENEDGQQDAGEHLPGVTDEQAHDAADESGIEALQAEAAENWNKYLRAVAEIDNLRKRNARDLEKARKFAVEGLAANLLPVRDSLEAGLRAAEEAEQASLDVTSLLEGERATLRLLDDALTSAGIHEIDPHGEPFDPERHEAMSMVPSTEAEPGSVLTVVQKGYELNQRVVRPARVIVAADPPAAEGMSGTGSGE